MTATTEYQRSSRLCAVRAYIRHHAEVVGAPRDIEDELKEMACQEVLAGASAWRAVKHAIEELDRRGDATNWWGISA